MLERFWRWQSRQRAAAFDWVFGGFLVFALVMAGWTHVKARKQRLTFEELQVCLTQSDAPGASAAVQRLRSLDADPVRLRIGQASVEVLLGNSTAARDTLSAAKTTDRLDAHTRGDLLLAQGDLALAEGRTAEAREKYTAARTLVQEGVADRRLERAAAREARNAEERGRNEDRAQADAERARNSADEARARATQAHRGWEQAQQERLRSSAEQLRATFNEALGAIESGNVEKARLLLADARRQAGALRGGAYDKAQVSFQAADRALSAVRARDEARAAMSIDSASLLGMSDEDRERHRRFQQALEDRLRQVQAEAQRALEETLPMARRLFDQAMTLADAQAQSPPGPQPGGPFGGAVR